MWPPITVRGATEADVGHIHALLNHYISTSTCIFREDPQSLDECRSYVTERAPAHPLLVAEEAGVIVGFGALSAFRSKSGYRRTVEDSVYVAQDRHRRGIGTTLLAALVTRAQELDHHQMVAVIEANQPVSVALHARHGFVEAGRLREVGFKFGHWLDAIVMQRRVAD